MSSRYSYSRSNPFRIVTYVVILTFLMNTIPAFGMQSTNYEIRHIRQNHGGGSRNTDNHQISIDAISSQMLDASSSENYSLSGNATIPLADDRIFTSVYINNDEERTSSTEVTLSLICSHNSGCSEVSISNNGVGWSATEPYSLKKNWSLYSNNGERSVFVKYKNGDGTWSGVCRDSIILDTFLPLTTISPTGGTYMAEPVVTITVNEPATIYYTTDGADPTTNSPVYTDPIVINSDTTLKCFALDLAGNQGPIVSEFYEICLDNDYSISGVVKDGNLDKTMPMTIVTLNTGQQSTTDINGAYSFNNLPRGYYEIESVTTIKPGYVTYQKELKLCKSSVVHDIILTKKETLFGGDTYAGYSVDSVNTATGNFIFKSTDLAIPGRGVSFAFDRAYNSQDQNDGPLGFGWTHNYNISLSSDTDGNIIVRWGDGKVETWAPDGTGGYIPMKGVFDDLIKNPDGTFTVKRKDLVEYHFNLSKKLIAIQDENENALTFTYVGDNLTEILDTTDRTIQFSYDAGGRITRILDPIGRALAFTYDGEGNLVSSTDLNGNKTQYTYDSLHQILTITDPLGNVVATNVYDEQNRVITSQRDVLRAQTSYTYDIPSRTTQIVDPFGNKSYHHFDDLLRLIQEDDPNGNSSYYEFDEKGNLNRVIDKKGNETNYQHDEKGNVLIKTDPLTNQTSATYDANNNPLTRTDANGNTNTFSYDTRGNLLTVNDPLGNTTGYTYNSYGEILTTTDALAHVTTKEYDRYGNLVEVVDALGSQSTFTYDLVGRKLTENYPLGRSKAFEYDNMNNVVSITDALGSMMFFEFDANGNKTEHTDPNNNKTTFGYDAKNRLIRKTNPLGDSELYGYDLLDRRTSVTNYNGATSRIVYDALGNVIQEIDALANTIRHEYDANGNKTKTIDAMGNETVFAYDADNRLVSTTDYLGNVTVYTYDGNGNQLMVTNAFGETTTSEYDELNRLKSVTDNIGNSITNDYDALGRLVKMTDARGNQIQFIFDASGRLTKVIDASSGEIFATYDAIGNRLSLTDTRGSSIFYTYDLLNRLTSETDPLGNTESHSYDSVGNLIAFTDSNGTISYSYDKTYRLKRITYPDDSEVLYSYDANGNCLDVSDSAGITSFQYNLRDQLTSVTDPFGMSVGYTYNSTGKRTSIKYPGNRSVTYFFDPLGRLSSVQDWSGISTNYQYDEVGRLSQKIMGNGSTVSFEYDSAGRLISKTDRDINSTIVARYVYTLDENGNRTSIDMSQPLLPVIGAVNDSFIYNEGNQLVSGGDATYAYDGKGRRIERANGSNTIQYTYNFLDRLTQVEDGINIDKYIYTSGGNLISSIRNGLETRYLLDLNGGMDNILAEMEDDNSIQKYYVYGDGLLYAFNASTGERLYYHYDPVGNTVATSDSSGDLVDQYAYLPFGKLSEKDETSENLFTFVGKYGVIQEDNGLYYMRARFYDPDTRTFLSKDPVKGSMAISQTLNIYAYALNNPLRFSDPKGEFILGGVGELALALAAVSAISYVGIQFAGWAAEKISDNDNLREDINFDQAVNATMKTTHAAHSLIVSSLKFDLKDFKDSVDDLYEIVTDTNNLEAKDETTLEMKEKSVNTTVNSTNESMYNVGYLKPSVITYNSITEDSGSKEAPIAMTQYKEAPILAPTQYLDVISTASTAYREEFAKLQDPAFFDHQTRSYIEMRIYSEISELSKKRYGYTTDKRRKHLMSRLNESINRSMGRLYSTLTNELSKYSVLVKDLSQLPDYNSRNINRRGVYAK